jgi:hypothetical protein
MKSLASHTLPEREQKLSISGGRMDRMDDVSCFFLGREVIVAIRHSDRYRLVTQIFKVNNRTFQCLR